MDIGKSETYNQLHIAFHHRQQTPNLEHSVDKREEKSLSSICLSPSPEWLNPGTTHGVLFLLFIVTLSNRVGRLPSGSGGRTQHPVRGVRGRKDGRIELQQRRIGV